MGRSSSCFKIITCGNDSKDEDEIDVIESKDSRDKRGWSFRKRSSQHRVLNNTVITETPSGVKENLETAVIDFQPPANSTDPEKTAVIHFTNEETHVPNIENPKGSDNIDVASKNGSKVDGQIEESIVIVIQACIRGLLAQRALLKLKNVVKVQAAVRGLLVRRHAVGTLRCVQAIVKMQTLVRARRAQLSLEGLAPDELHMKHEKENPGSKIMVKGELTKSNLRYISIDKLLSNSFARQLLESTPRNKPINIKCDPSKHDSAWKWLERWMAVSSLDILEPKKAESVTEQVDGENEESHVEDGIDSKAFLWTEDLNSGAAKSVLLSESEDLITCDANNVQFQTCHSPSLLVRDNMEQPQPENTDTSEVKEISTEVISIPDQRMQLDAGLQTELNSLSDKPEMDIEQVNPLKRIAPEQLETEGKKIVLGSRKVCNPSFISAQAKFEQLSLAPDTSGTTSSMDQDTEVEPHSESVSSTADIVLRMKEQNAVEDSILSGSSVTQVGGSECGIDLSVSSTVDSPDGSEAGGLADAHANDVSKKGVQDPRSNLNTEVEVKDASTIPVQNDLQFLVDQPEKIVNSKGHSVTSVAVLDSAPTEAKPEKSSPDLQGELDADMGRQAYRSSPEASPRSHLTVPESQGTPSSQVSMKAKQDKTEKTGSRQKQRSLSAVKKSPSNPNRNSGTRSGVEHFHKDQKNEKRRNSFDAARPDHIERELRDSSSNNSLPHFMQATESARAKVNATNSPRSSPDVQDREMYIKKRHSLPADGRQGSPRIQQPISRAQQGVKANEKMWRR